MTNVQGYDATHAGLPAVPGGAQVAGYSTGTDGSNGTVPILWDAADAAAHPGWIQIDQSPDLTALDEQADVLDIESGAATNTECAQWYTAALANYQSAARPGQRWPAIYTSLSNVTALVNQLIADGVTSGPRLWVAHWGISLAQAEGILSSSGGPFPIIGVQYQNGADYDYDVWLSGWLDAVSGQVTSNVLPPFMSATPWLTVNFGWDSSPTASADTDYHLQVADTAGNTVYDHRTAGNNDQVTGLRPGSYQWRLAVGQDAEHLASPWSGWMPIAG